MATSLLQVLKDQQQRRVALHTKAGTFSGVIDILYREKPGLEPSAVQLGDPPGRFGHNVTGGGPNIVVAVAEIVAVTVLDEEGT